ncbi:AI-2E family transporter, partial [Acinetobacter baumannii]
MSCIVICTVALLTGTTRGLFFAFPNPYLYAAGLFVAFFCVTLTWDMLISPRVVGSAVDLHPLVSMFVVFCGGALFGLPGMVLAYPVAGIVKV